MVDQQRGGAPSTQLAEPAAEDLALVGVETRRPARRGRADAGRADQRPGDADQLPLPEREVGRRARRRAIEVEQRQGLVDPGVDDRPAPQQTGDEAPRSAGNPQATDEVLAHRQVVEQLGGLPGAGQAPARPPVRRQPEISLPRERHAPRAAGEAA